MRAKGGIDLAPSAVSTALVQDSVTIRQVMLTRCIFNFGVYFITEPTRHAVFLHGTLVLFQRFDRKWSPATFVSVVVDSESSSVAFIGFEPEKTSHLEDRFMQYDLVKR